MSEKEVSREHMTSINIESAKPVDAQGIIDVQKNTWLATYVNEEYDITAEDIEMQYADNESIKKGWQERIEDNKPGRHYIVARQGNDIVGFCYAREDDDKNKIQSLYVLPKCQGTGTGGTLLQEALRRLGDEKDIYLGVASYNEGAIAFYEHMGFEISDDDIGSSAATLHSGKVIPEVMMIKKRNK